MKKTGSILWVILLALVVQGCSGNAYKDNKETADSNNTTKGTEHSNDSTVTGYDARFIIEAVNKCTAQAELGKLAEQKSVNPEVKAFGAMMFEDHLKCEDELKTLAQRKNIYIHGTLSREQQEAKDNLSARSGHDFDKAYLHYMVNDHESNIRFLVNASKNLTDPDLKTFVAYSLRSVKMHLEHCKAVAGKMK